MQVEQHRTRLNLAIQPYLGDGYRVVSQTDTTAQLVRPKRFSFMWFLFWSIVTLGAGIILYPLYHLALKRETQVYLTVAPDGHVDETRTKR